MDISFNAIAFALKYSSAQIEEIYSSLFIVNKGAQKIPAFALGSMYHLPESFTNYVSVYEVNVNIVFEPRTIPDDNVKFNDWDLMETFI